MQPKQADVMTAASPLPQVEIKTTLAPGKRGPVGTAPRTDYSRVNTGSPPAPDAGATEQKSMAPRGAEMLPKIAASEDSMGQQIAARPTINDMVKKAMAGAMQAVDVNREAARQAENLGEQVLAKTASASAASTSVDYDEVEKLAAACDFASMVVKQASLGHNHVEPGKGPGALEVLTPQGGENPIKPNNQGHGHTAQVSGSGALQKSTSAGPATQLENNINHPAGGSGGQPLAMVNQKSTKTAAEEKCAKCGKDKEKCACDKTASVDVAAIRASWAAKTAGVKTSADKTEKKETEGLEEAKAGLAKAEGAHKSEPENKEASNFMSLAGVLKKVAEDAINPAKISAGSATPPDTREAGQPGGVRPKGSGPGMVSSAQSAIHYTKGQAKAEAKSDSGRYWNEPSLSGATDKTLSLAFKHTGEAGTKFASAGPQAVSTAAARALLQKIAAEADEKKKGSQTTNEGTA